MSAVWKLFIFQNSENIARISYMFTPASDSIVAYNFNCLLKNFLITVIGSQALCNRGIISETVQDRD